MRAHAFRYRDDAGYGAGDPPGTPGVVAVGTGLVVTEPDGVGVWLGRGVVLRCGEGDSVGDRVALGDTVIFFGTYRA